MGPEIMYRDREATERKLIEATGRVLARQGFAKVGVNAIAREAGVDKVLIYRYFEGLSGLMRRYARQGDFWPSTEELIGANPDAFDAKTPADKVATVMENLAEGVRRRPLTLEILAWEMTERNELTAHLEEVREQQGLALTKILAGDMEARGGVHRIDLGALAAILAAAINYLAARSRKIDWFNGVPLKEDGGWRRLTGVMRTICECVLDI
jgi:AcrR family transcriptional regulator